MVMLVVMLTVLMASLAGGLALLGHTERSIASAHARTIQTAYAAGAAAQLAVGMVARDPGSPRWPSAGMVPSLGSVSRVMAVPASDPVDLDARTAELNLDASRLWPLGADTPRWRLAGWGRLPEWTPVTMRVAVWIADDVMDGDGMAGEDSNGVLMVRAEAFGPRGASRTVVAHIRRGPADVQVLSWREQ